MPLLTKSSSSAWAALTYVTVGALTLVWTAVYFAYQWNMYGSAGSGSYYWCAGFFATGVVLLGIGLTLGQIGRAARHAELPPEEVTPAIANAVQNAAARAPMMAPNPAAPMVMPGQPVQQMQQMPAGPAPVLPATPASPHQ